MPDYLKLDVQTIERQINALVEAYPELAEDEALRADMIEGETDLMSVMTRLLDHQQEAASMVDAMKSRKSDLGERISRYERRSDAMRSLMLNLLSAADQTKITLPEATISLTKGRDAVEIIDINALPQGFYSLERKADRTAIGAALKAGEVVPGAALRTGDATLTVRTK
jgi:hypothetical protein